MRFLYPLIALTVFAISCSIWITTAVFTNPAEEARSFLSDISSGDLSKSVRHFGGNSCRCPAKGGWGSYLIYVSAQEPNLAFLVGHPFNMGTATASKMKSASNQKSVVPWEQPEDVAIDIPLTFDEKKYQPLFLPLPMAYGQAMTVKEWKEFLADPDKDAWKGFTLRFRPSLKQGMLAAPKETISDEMRHEFEALKEAEKSEADKAREEAEQAREENDPFASKETSAEEMKTLFGEDAMTYIQPKDAGVVKDENGKEIAVEDLEKQLPRLKSATMRLHIVRRGQLKDWTVYHFGMMEPVLQYPDGHTVKLENDRRPS